MILSSYIHSHVVSNLYGASFILWNIKDSILKNVGNQRVMSPIDFHSMSKKYNGQWEPKPFSSKYQSTEESHTGSYSIILYYLQVKFFLNYNFTIESTLQMHIQYN